MKARDLRSRLFLAYTLILLLAGASMVVTAASFLVSSSLLQQQLDNFQRLKTAIDNLKYFSQMETAEFRFKREQMTDQVEIWNFADSRLRDLLRVARLGAQTPAEINALRQIQNRLDDYGMTMRQMFALGLAGKCSPIGHRQRPWQRGYGSSRLS